MSAMYEDAKRVTPELTKDKGTEILVQRTVIDFLTDTIKKLDAKLATIPTLLEQHEITARYSSNELVQRGIIREGFEAVKDAVRADSIDNLKKMGFYGRVQRDLAEQNVSGIPAVLGEDIKWLINDIIGLASDLQEIGFDLGALWFRNGKLRVPPKYQEGLLARFTIEVSKQDRKTVEKLREAVKAVKEAKEAGLSYDLIRSMANGSEYTDAELLAMLHGIHVKR